MNNANNRALAIIRVSTTEQAHEERYSIPHQKTHITEECRHRGLDLFHFCEFVQSGAKVLSNSSKERAEVLNYIKHYRAGVVIVHELDRLARSMLDTLLFVDELNQLGVTFISIHDGFDTSTPQGQLQMHILAAFAEYFRKQLAAKVIGGMIERAKQGKPMGRRPLGYRVGLNGYEIDVEEAKIVRTIYSMYLEQNLGLRAIAGHLNGMGLKSLRGNNWSHISVREILENEVYTGTFTWSDIRVEDNHPAIIDRLTWETARARRRRKKELGGRAQNSFYLLSGLLRCGTCNCSTLVGRTAIKGNYQYRYYTCNNYASKGLLVCPSGYIRAEIIDKIVIDDIELFAKQLPAEIKKETIPTNISLLKEQVELKRKELTTLNLMFARASEAYEKGMYDLDWFSMRKTKIAEDRAAVEAEITGIENKIRGNLTPEETTKRMTEKIKIAKSFLEESDHLKAKARLQELIASIIVKNENNIKIRYRL